MTRKARPTGNSFVAPKLHTNVLSVTPFSVDFREEHVCGRDAESFNLQAALDTVQFMQNMFL